MKPIMPVSLVCIGKLRERALKDLADVYVGRLARYARFELQEVPHERVTRRHGPTMAALARSFECARQRLVLDVGGRAVDSPGLAALVRGAEEGGGGLSFVIGGPEGVPSEVLARATGRISLSACTFPHELFRVMFLEQLYRAFTIVRGEPYHK